MAKKVEEISQARVIYPACVVCGSTDNERRADKRMKSGWSSYCRACANAKSLEWKRNNLTRQLATTKAWRQANPEKVKQYRNKPEARQKEREAAINWRKSNLERARTNDAAWRRNNPDKARLKDLARAERLKNAVDEKITPQHLAHLREWQDKKCAYCMCDLQESGYHIDHFVPIAKGGRHASDNLLLACPACNLQKGAKPPLEFMDKKEPSKIKTSEAREQSRVVMWSHKKEVRDSMPALKWLHHSANGEKRDAITGNKLKAMGLKRGFPDLILPVASNGRSGLAIEMKSAIGHLTAEQSAWLKMFDDQGWTTHVCRSANEARDAICSYLSVSPDKLPTL